jgi:hypothetical protein
MALTKNMAYDHPAYTVPFAKTGFNTAGATATSLRFAAFTAMIAKSLTGTVVVAGTGTGNATILAQKIAAGGTAITTLGPLVVLGTNALGFTTNVLMTNGAISAGDVVSVLHGADATSVFAVALELVLTPGASVTP